MVSIVKNGKAVDLKAISGKVSLSSGDKLIITDGVSGQSTQKLITKKVGHDLAIYEEGAGEPSAVLEEYYNTPMVQLEGVEGNLYIANENQEGFELLTGSLEAPAAGEAVAVASAVGGGTTATAGLSTMSMIGLGGVGVAGAAIAYKQLKVIPETTVPDTTAPTITSGSTSTDKDENSGAGQLIYTATATDTSAITYSLKNTGDSNLLSINSTTGAVTLIDNPDYETKSAYSFTVIATDSAGNASERAVSFNVLNLDEIAPTITSESIGITNENANSSTVIYTLNATDTADISAGVTYSLSGADEALLDLNTATGEVTLKTSSDYETKSTYSFSVVVDDGVNASTIQDIVLNVTNLDEVAPTITSTTTAPTINENSGTGQVVYTVTSTDTADTATGLTIYSLKNIEDYNLLNIDSSTGEVSLIDNPDYETKSSYGFTVIATDTVGNASEQIVSFNILNLDEVAPTITSGTTETINENDFIATVIYTVSSDDTTDISAGVTYSLSGTDASLLNINATSGEVRLNNSANYESQTSYNFTVVANDGVTTPTTKDVVVSITNLDEIAPTITSATTAPTINENSGAGQLIYTATSTDTDDIANGSTTYSLSRTDALLFNINSTTGEVTLTANPDYETKPSYSFTVIATDQANNASEQAVTLAINNLDESAPTITTGTTGSVNENSATSTVIYTLNATDTADISSGVIYSLSGADEVLLDLNTATGEVTLKTFANYETKNSYNFTVVASDGVNAPTTKAVVVNVNNLDEVAPLITSSATAPTKNENSGAEQIIYTVTSTDTVDIAIGSTAYSLKNTGDYTALSINSSTGAVTLTGNPDYETKPSYSFTVIAADQAGNVREQSISMNINNFDEAPLITSASTAVSIDEKTSANQIIYTAHSIDPEGSSVSYSLKNTGDYNSLNIDSITGAVTLHDVPNYVTKNNYNFTVISTDTTNNMSEKSVNLAINNINEMPTFFGVGTGIKTFNGIVPSSVAIQNDGKIVVAGYTASSELLLLRYNSNGMLDSTFDTDGKVITSLGNGAITSSVMLQNDGKIIVAGYAESTELLLLRYNSDGTLDSTFDTDGKVITSLWNATGFSGVTLSSVTLQDDGKIVVAGNVFNASTSDSALARYNSDGTLDSTFDTDGIVVTSFGNTVHISSTTMQNDGKIIVVGYTSLNEFLLMRYNSDGTLDSTFDTDGKVITSFENGAIPSSVTLQDDGKIVVSGVFMNGSMGTDADGIVVRYNSDGTLDTTFGIDGKVIVSFGNYENMTDVTIQDDSRIVVTGVVLNGSLSNGIVARYNTDGSLDTTFNPINTLNAVVQYTEGASAVIMDNDVVLTDSDLNFLGNYDGASISLSRHGGADSTDQFSGAGIIAGASSGDVIVSSVTVGSYTYVNGALEIVFNTNATQNLVNQTLQNLAYSSNSTSTLNIQMDWSFNDGNSGLQGIGGSLSVVGSTTISIDINGFASGTSASVFENADTSTIVYDAFVADAGEAGMTYSFLPNGGADYGLFTIDSNTGEVRFNLSPDYQNPLDRDGNNIYEFTIRATDSVGSHTYQNVALSVSTPGQSVFDLGSYGKLIDPIQVDGNWYYYWDRSGDGTSYDSGDDTTHDVLDGLFNHDINGVVNTTVQNYDGNYGTTNDYRYATINGIKLALPTAGAGYDYESGQNYLDDNQNYTDLAEIWDSTNGAPGGWSAGNYWSATPSVHGHAIVTLYYGLVGDYTVGDNFNARVALQVL